MEFVSSCSLNVSWGLDDRSVIYQKIEAKFQPEIVDAIKVI